MCLGVSDAHSAKHKINNQQGPAVPHRGLCSILCNNPMVTRGKDGGRIVRESGMDMDTLLDLTRRTSKDLLDSAGDSAQSSVITLWFPGEGWGQGESGSLGWTWTHGCI